MFKIYIISLCFKILTVECGRHLIFMLTYIVFNFSSELIFGSGQEVGRSKREMIKVFVPFNDSIAHDDVSFIEYEFLASALRRHSHSKLQVGWLFVEVEMTDSCEMYCKMVVVSLCDLRYGASDQRSLCGVFSPGFVWWWGLAHCTICKTTITNTYR